MNDVSSYVRNVATLIAEFGTPLTILAVLIAMGFRVNQEYERGVVYRLGRLKGIKGPGVVWLIPFLERMIRLDIRVVTVTLQTQETVTRDGVQVRSTPCSGTVSDPRLAVNAVLDRNMAVIQAAETSLRDSIGQSSLDDLLKNRMRIDAELMDLLWTAAKKWAWGSTRSRCAVSTLPSRCSAPSPGKRGRREAKARLIKAQGGPTAAATLVDAARAIGECPPPWRSPRCRRLSVFAAGARRHHRTSTMPTEFTALASKLSKA